MEKNQRDSLEYMALNTTYSDFGQQTYQVWEMGFLCSKSCHVRHLS